MAIRNGRRTGAAAPFIIMLLPLLTAAMALAVEIAIRSHRQLQLQNTAEASTLAAANALAPTKILVGNAIVNDILLTDRADRQRQVNQDARLAAARYAVLNPFPGGETPLDLNPTNAVGGELLVGTLDSPNDAPVWYTPDTFPGPNLYTPNLNAVRIEMERLDVRVSATAYVDRDVVGFKVQGTSDILTTPKDMGTPAIPLVPLAVLTDWTNAMNDQSWEYNIINRQGNDSYSLNAADTPVSGADGIKEITVKISDNATGNGQMVAVGGNVAVALTQVTTGITGAQLAVFDVNRQLMLDQGGVNRKELNQLAPNATDLTSLQTELGKILGKRRVWMLYDSVDTGKVNVVGFAAARVMSVSSATNMGVTTISVVLQPTMLLTSTALTDRSRRLFGPRKVMGTESIFNPYVARVRLLK